MSQILAVIVIFTMMIAVKGSTCSTKWSPCVFRENHAFREKILDCGTKTKFHGRCNPILYATAAYNTTRDEKDLHDYEFSYVGCYKQKYGVPDMPDKYPVATVNWMNVFYCQQYCTGFPFFSILEKTYCRCGFYYGRHGKSTKCRRNCNLQFCGEQKSMAVYAKIFLASHIATVHDPKDNLLVKTHINADYCSSEFAKKQTEFRIKFVKAPKPVAIVDVFIFQYPDDTTCNHAIKVNGLSGVDFTLDDTFKKTGICKYKASRSLKGTDMITIKNGGEFRACYIEVYGIYRYNPY